MECSDRITAFGVPSADIEKAWPLFKKLIDDACLRSNGKFIGDDIKKSLISRDMQLWGVSDGKKILAAVVSEIVNYPRLKACRVLIGTGENYENWARYIQIVETWGKSQGCTLIELITRPGWKKPMKEFGFKETHVHLEKGL